MKKNPNDYADCAAVLDAALAVGGGKYTLPTYGNAIRWAQRAYNLRNALRELAAQTCAPGQAPFTKYDDIVLRVEKPKADKATPHTVTIELKRSQGVLTDLEGNPIKPRELSSTTPGKSDEEINEWLTNLD